MADLDELVVRAVAAGRLVLGGAFTAAPASAAGGWVGAGAGRGDVQAVARGLGIRDLLLGVGTLERSRRGPVPAGWLWAGALADGTDAVATLLAWRQLPRFRRAGLVALAGGAAATQALLAVRASRR